MSDVFLSYARQNEERAESLAAALRREGWTVWWDAELYVGREFPQEIMEAINDAKCVVVLWSSNSVTSKWVAREAKRGAERGVLAPAMLELGVSIPKPYKLLHAAQLADWDGRANKHHGFEKLCEAIRSLAGPGQPLASQRLQSTEVAKIPQATGLAAAFGSLWVSSDGPGSLIRIDPSTGQTIAEIQAGPAWPCVAGASYVWLTQSRGVIRVDPESNEVNGKFKLGPYRGGVSSAVTTENVLWITAMTQWQQPELHCVAADTSLKESGSPIEISPSLDPIALSENRLLVGTNRANEFQVLRGPSLAVDKNIPADLGKRKIICEDSLWYRVADDDTTLCRLDFKSLKVTKLQFPESRVILAFSDGDIFFKTLDGSSATIMRFQLATGVIEQMHNFRGILDENCACVGGGYLWVAVYPPPRLLQLDIESGALVAEIRINVNVRTMKFHGGALWVCESGNGQFIRIDSKTSMVTATIDPGPKSGCHFGHDSIWFLTENRLWRVGPRDSGMMPQCLKDEPVS